MENINMNINPDTLQDIGCGNCQGQLFTPSFMIKKVSALQSPTGEKMMIPMQVFKCDSCGDILDPETN
tara:strand:- start:2511 stop:2714 length:204 start_codon:yes stop_codon:yes gene_type:complete